MGRVRVRSGGLRAHTAPGGQNTGSLLWRVGHDAPDADASAHRLASDISTFIGQQRIHRLIVAGDLNVLFRFRNAILSGRGDVGAVRVAVPRFRTCPEPTQPGVLRHTVKASCS